MEVGLGRSGYHAAAILIKEKQGICFEVIERDE